MSIVPLGLIEGLTNPNGILRKINKASLGASPSSNSSSPCYRDGELLNALCIPPVTQLLEGVTFGHRTTLETFEVRRRCGNALARFSICHTGSDEESRFHNCLRADPFAGHRSYLGDPQPRERYPDSPPSLSAAGPSCPCRGGHARSERDE